jgi:hypothetical protein
VQCGSQLPNVTEEPVASIFSVNEFFSKDGIGVLIQKTMVTRSYGMPLLYQSTRCHNIGESIQRCVFQCLVGKSFTIVTDVHNLLRGFKYYNCIFTLEVNKKAPRS